VSNHLISEELKKIKCPNCGKEMQHGYIAGKGMLWWTEKERPKTLFSMKKLKKTSNLWSAPTIESMKCDECKIGVFRFDY